MKIRLHKWIATSGVASRRAAERLMQEGRVTVNGQPVREPGAHVDPDHDVVLVDGQALPQRHRLTVALHKPPGYVCSRTRQTPKQRLVGELLPPEWSDLYPVGRLDRDSEGLLLLTNDGELCLRLTHPRYGLVKSYRATVVGKLLPAHLRALVAGVTDQGETLRARRARVLSANASHSIVELELTEGRRHEVRRMFEALGHPVERLVRLRVGPLQLGELPPGRWRVLTDHEIAALRSTVSPSGRHSAPSPAADSAPAAAGGRPAARGRFRASSPRRTGTGRKP